MTKVIKELETSGPRRDVPFRDRHSADEEDDSNSGPDDGRSVGSMVWLFVYHREEWRRGRRVMVVWGERKKRDLCLF